MRVEGDVRWVGMHVGMVSCREGWYAGLGAFWGDCTRGWVYGKISTKRQGGYVRDGVSLWLLMEAAEASCNAHLWPLPKLLATCYADLALPRTKLATQNCTIVVR